MAKGPVLKTGEGVTAVWVRIPVPPPSVLERWLSGRKRSPAKGVSVDKTDRGFESHSLRHFNYLRAYSSMDRASDYGSEGWGFKSS